MWQLSAIYSHGSVVGSVMNAAMRPKIVTDALGDGYSGDGESRTRCCIIRSWQPIHQRAVQG